MSAFLSVAEYLPHDPPMVLLDSVLAKEDGVVTCAVTLRDGAAFVSDGRLSAVVTLEYMAQAAGVFAGIEAKARRESIRWGFLIGCSELLLAVDALVVGDALVVSAKRVWGDARLGQFECLVTRADQRIASATLNVAQADIGEIPA